MSRMIPVFLMVILLGASYSQMSWVEPEKEISEGEHHEAKDARDETSED